MELTIMFETFISQYLNKLVEGKVRDFPTPQAFHAVKVQRFGGDGIKPITEVSGEFEMPIFALVGNFTIKPSKVSDSTPPITRAFFLPGYRLVEFAKFFQGAFQELWRLYLLAIRECQIRLHTEVYAHAFTCGAENFFGNIIGDNIQPIPAYAITKDLNITDVPFPVTMVVEQKETLIILIELFGFRIPLPKRNANTPFSKQITCLELRRPILFSLFELRRADTPAALAVFDPIKELFPSKVQADNHSVKCITRYPRPVFMAAFEQLRQMGLQTISTHIFTINAVISLFQSKEVVMDIGKIVKNIAKTFVLRVVAYLIFIGSQSVTSYQSLTPYEWVGRHATLR